MPDLAGLKSAIKKVLNIIGEAVGTTDTQTLTNKTLGYTTVQTDQNEILDIYRPSTNEAHLSFHHNNSVAARVRTTAITSTLIDSTATAEDTALSFWIFNNGVFFRTIETSASLTMFNSAVNRFKDQNLTIMNPAATFSFIFNTTNIAAHRAVTLPLITADDTFVFEAHAQTLTNKTIAAGSNTISGIADTNIASHTSTKVTITAKGQLNSSIIYSDQTNTFGDFDQLLRSGRLKLRNPANTFSYLFTGSAIVADRTWTLPLLTGNDTAVAEAHTQTLTNKTVNATNNTITDTSIATGDLMASSGSKFVRRAKGTGLQVLRTNTGATDIEWATLDNERVGKHQANGNAASTVFNIAHGLGSNPTYAFAICSSITNTFTYTTDATNIIITFSTAPASGTNNVVINWRVMS